jgi:hypothetical protein
MKQLLLLVFLFSLLSVRVYSIDPPLGLKWGMPYEEAKSHLESKENDLDDLEELENLPNGFMKAEIDDDIELKGEDTKTAFLVFDSEEKLALVNYIFEFWDYVESVNYHKQLKEALILKYGEPVRDEAQERLGEAMIENMELVVSWYDEKSNEEVVLLWAFTNKLGMDYYYISLQYLSSTYKDAEKEAVNETDEL